MLEKNLNEISKEPSSGVEKLVRTREALASDIPALLEIQKSVSDTHTYSALLDESNWGKMLKKYKVFLIEKENTPVGDLAYEYKDPNNVYIADLAVIPSFQGQGIAREVLVNLLKELNEVKRIDLVTHPENLKAIKLYESLGFVFESTKENYFGDGEPRSTFAIDKNETKS